MTVHDIQQKLFQAILSRYSSKSEGVLALRQLMDKSQDAIYRRLRGATPLTAHEFALLAQHFGISMDALARPDADQVLFTYNLQLGQVGKVEDYLQHVLDLATELSHGPSPRVQYTAREIPVFHYYSFYPLFAFKMFVYAQTYWTLDGAEKATFQLHPRPQPATELARQIAGQYLKLDSVEIWNPDLLNNTINQILYFLDTKQFARPEEASILCDSLLNMISWTRAMADRGEKFLPDNAGAPGLGAYRLYLNELSSTSDTMLITGNGAKTLITSFGTPNFLRSNEERLCLEVEQWMAGIVRRSTPLSHKQARHRELFFNRLQQRVDRAREEIQRRLNG